MSTPDGGSAYPYVVTVDNVHSGMTMRDYFAAQALPLLRDDKGKLPSPDKIADAAYAIADAMLIVRSA